MLGVIGKKIGMTQFFGENGILIPVTLIKVEPNVVLGERIEDKHGYNAVILGSINKKKSRVKKPYGGQFPEGVEPTQCVAEFRDYERDCKVGERLGVDIFDGVDFVDIRGKTKGKGFQGVMRRHGFSGGRKTHGSKFHRVAGSTGQAASPSKVMKGTKMAGRMGNQNRTVQNLKIVNIDPEKEILLVRGSIPGRKDSILYVTKSNKK